MICIDNQLKQLEIISNSLMDPNSYPHSVDNINVIETHISWVILTGQYAYKIKKAINYGFIKTITIKERIHFCQEEIRLNRRLSLDLYIGLSKIVGTIESSKIEDYPQNSIHNNHLGLLEVAVKMKQFKSDKLLSNRLDKKNNELRKYIDLGKSLAKFHFSLPKKEIDNIYKFNQLSTDNIYRNIDLLKTIKMNKVQLNMIDSHYLWVKNEAKRLEKVFYKRIELGVVKECHGDLHCENIWLNENEDFEPFDSIDFNPNLRWIDPISEIAFLSTDLEVRGLFKESIELVNTWLEETGDYCGVTVLNWYSAYRSLVRAKVVALTLKQFNLKTSKFGNSGKSKQQLNKLLNSYISTAIKKQHYNNRFLIIMHGISGSGKSYLSRVLIQEFQAIRIRSDIERKRIFGKLDIQKELQVRDYLLEKEIPNNFTNTNLYSIKVTNWLYQKRIPSLVESCIKGGQNTIIDAAFLKFEERKSIIKVANSQNTKYIIVNCECNDSIGFQRIRDRIKKGNDPSDADINIRSKQKSWLEPLTSDEKKFEINYNEYTSLKQVISKIRLIIEAN